MNLRHAAATGALLSVLSLWGQEEPARYHVLDGITAQNMIVFPVTSKRSYKTGEFLTLDEGISSGKVVITEMGAGGMVRPSVQDGNLWGERPRFQSNTQIPQVNELSILNRSDQPLIVLAGEIVTGGKQDRIVGQDRIIPAHSGPVSLNVFCVEPHRWLQNSSRFSTMKFTMAQPAIRESASAEQNQASVWDQVAKARRALAASVDSSSYANAMSEAEIRSKVDRIAGPASEAFDELQKKLRSQGAVGCVIAIDKRLVWMDVFASPELFGRYWPKLVRSYAAEAATTGQITPLASELRPTRDDAQRFLDFLPLNHESISTDPGVYRSTEINGPDFRASLLTALLPDTGFLVHLAKMRCDTRTPAIIR